MKFPLAGSDAPTPAREKGLQPHWALYCFEKRPGVQANKRQCELRRLFAPRKALWCARRRKPLAPLIRRLPEGGAGGRAESHPAFLPEYLYPVGFFANYGPKVSKGERREAGIQWIQPPKAVSDPEFRQTTSGAHGSAGRADCLPRGKPFGAPAGANPCPQ